MARPWRDSVLDALARLSGRRGGDVIDRQALIAEELPRIVAETESRGATPHQTLSRVLQDLRDEGLLEFLGNGQYRLTGRPVDIEAVDLSDEQIDAALRRRLLRFGQAETGTELAASRRRRGQERLRALTLDNYGYRCALCDVTERSLLVASHILGWAEAPDARGDLSNILCLCRFHDALFELGYWSLTNDLGVLTRSGLESTTLRALLAAGLTFRRPRLYSPAPAYLTHHRKRHGLEDRGAGA